MVVTGCCAWLGDLQCSMLHVVQLAVSKVCQTLNDCFL